ncbi:MAG: translation initiation factor [Nitrososphaerales archaeon]
MAEICSNCGLPLDLCVCEELEKEETRIVVRLEMRRFRKPTTMIEGLNPKRTDLEKIAQQLKNKFACGGTAKDGYILLQGDHRDNIKDQLIQLGFNDSSIEVQ